MEEKYSFSFVILNYVTTEDTIACVNSIKKYCSNYKCNIIIVDNASPNKSGEKLSEIYKDDESIKIFINKENIGFAKGNNIGFEYAKNILNSDFIILCNSDTEILDNAFCNNIITKYEDSQFAVLGPREKLPDGTFYPLNEKIRSKHKIKLDIKLYNSILNNKNSMIHFYKFRIKLYDKFSKKHLDANNEYSDIVLHGAFLIFSRKYIDLFDGLNSITYFYGEEEFLKLRLEKNNLHSKYYPKIEILHKKNSATNASTETKEKKKIFTTKCHLDSSINLLAAINGEIEV